MNSYKTLIPRMTLQEKAALLGGKGEWETRDIPRLGIPSMVCSDGPSGLRRQAGTGDHLGLNPSLPATCFPCPSLMACSWDQELEEAIGAALGEEAADQGVDILLGPGLNIKRNPLCGRNFEYFSEDPYFSGKMAAAFIRGVESQGIAACPKHFAVNSQELRRMAMNAVVDERTLREIYLTGFETAIKEGKCRALMTSYNQVNGIYANEHPHLLKEILRKEWGFCRAVITDWGGSNDHCAGVKNGSSLEMPAPGLSSAAALLKGVEEGRITEQDLDERVEEILNLLPGQKKMFKQNKMPENSPEREPLYEAHHHLARRACAESVVLLKNETDTLPLKSGTRIAVIGDFAYESRYQGAGSSMVNAWKVDSVKECLEGETGLEWKKMGITVSGFSRGYLRDGRQDAALEKEAVDLAKTADQILFFFGLNEAWETEGMDRSHLRIPENQIHLLERLSRLELPVVGILCTGSVVEMPWEGHLKALLYGGLWGQAGAGAVLDLLSGKLNPCGKLAESWPVKYEDTPSFQYYPSKERNSEYREGIYVGYRYYDTAGVPIRFPFGFGLSYTKFDYSGLKITPEGVSFVLENTGSRDGAEIIQLYTGLPGARIFRPKRELKGFCKVFLKVGEKKEVFLPFDSMTFRYWNGRTGQWEREGGFYRISIGSGLTDIRLEGEVFQEGTTDSFPWEVNELPSYASGRIRSVPDEEYERLLGCPIPDGSWKGELGINDALCQMYYAKSPLARLICRILKHRLENAQKKGIPDLNTLFQYNMPFRAMAKMTGGWISMEMAESLTYAANGRHFYGITGFIRGFLKNRRLERRYEQALKGKTAPEDKTEPNVGNPWSKAHPQLWEFMLFNLLSNCATITNFVVMWLCTGWVFKGLADIPFRFFIFDYGEDALGLCGFLSFLTATALAQMVNFFVQKNWVFRSDAAFSRAAPRYILLAVFLVILSAALPAWSQKLFTGLGVPEAFAPTCANGLNILAQVAISYPAMKFWIMPGQARPKKNKKKRRKK